jgi:uncharacterized protein YjbI with pentapeptide repeats
MLLSEFVDASFTSSTFGRSVLTKTTFTRSSLVGISGTSASFPGGVWTKVNIANANLVQSNLRGIESSGLTGTPLLPANAKIVSGALQLAPAAPVYVGTSKVGKRFFLNWKEVSQTGAKAVMKYRISTNNKTWGKWITAAGTRTKVFVNRYTEVKVQMSGIKAKKKYYIQAYFTNAQGKSATVKKTFIGK